MGFFGLSGLAHDSGKQTFLAVASEMLNGRIASQLLQALNFIGGDRVAALLL